MERLLKVVKKFAPVAKQVVTNLVNKQSVPPVSALLIKLSRRDMSGAIEVSSGLRKALESVNSSELEKLSETMSRLPDEYAKQAIEQFTGSRGPSDGPLFLAKGIQGALVSGGRASLDMLRIDDNFVRSLQKETFLATLPGQKPSKILDAALALCVFHTPKTVEEIQNVVQEVCLSEGVGEKVKEIIKSERQARLKQSRCVG